MRSVFLDSKPVATQVPLSNSFVPVEGSVRPESKYLLSRFVYMRRYGNQMILQSPLSASWITLQHPKVASMIHTLSTPCSVSELSQATDMPEKVISEVLDLLLSSQMICEMNQEGKSPEDEMAALQTWEFHDLLFHSRTRGGRHGSPVGGTYRFAGRMEMPPALKEVPEGTIVPLYKPDLERMLSQDPPYARVQEDRSSIREYSEQPISAAQLGEFLFRSCRMTDYFRHVSAEPYGTMEMEFVSRPYPSGGGLYELQQYIAINRCKDLEAGMYYYNPEKHCLHLIASGITSEMQRLLEDAGRSTMVPSEKIQVLFVITARFQRIAWKYQSIAYSLILKNLGCLYQTMYLSATAMGLAPCAIGYGDADLFSKIVGTDYYAETSVGEFLLGSCDAER